MSPKKQKDDREPTTAGEILTDMAINSNIRTGERSKKLQADYEGEVEDLRDRIDGVVEEDMFGLSNLRTSQLTRLAALIQRRGVVENAIVGHMDVLEKAYERVNKMGRWAIGYRIEDLKAGMEALKDEKEGESDKENEDPEGKGGNDGMRDSSKGKGKEVESSDFKRGAGTVGGEEMSRR